VARENSKRSPWAGAETRSVRTVVSKDGTVIGYRKVGTGPGLVMVHGGMMTGQNLTELATALADDFTVYVPDRRGRGLSGPVGDYSLQKEIDDLSALLVSTDTRHLFGLSFGAIVSLATALEFPEIHKLVLYEPPLSVNNSYSLEWVKRYDQELAQGRLGAAMVSIMKGTQAPLGALPRFLLVPLMTLAVKADAKEAHDDRVPLHALIPTMHHDARSVAEASGVIDQSKNLSIPVLLMGGSKSPSYLKTALHALAETLPHATRITLPRVGHLAADNGGKPELVARHLRGFFSN
jgi:pimeloyl-ACP methyl ester carboxylesterase